MSSLAPNSQRYTSRTCALASSTAARSGSVLRRHLLLYSTECRPRLPSSSAIQRPFSSSLSLIAAALQPYVPCTGSCTGPLLPPCGLSVCLVLLLEPALARTRVFFVLPRVNATTPTYWIRSFIPLMSVHWNSLPPAVQSDNNPRSFKTTVNLSLDHSFL